jgi:hypothetical protein
MLKCLSSIAVGMMQPLSGIMRCDNDTPSAETEEGILNSRARSLSPRGCEGSKPLAASSDSRRRGFDARRRSDWLSRSVMTIRPEVSNTPCLGVSEAPGGVDRTSFVLCHYPPPVAVMRRSPPPIGPQRLPVVPVE